MSARTKERPATWRDRVPVDEAVLATPAESFVWRRDDYPLPRSVWNAHSECEIHLIRNAEGTSYIGDHISHFVPGDLFLIGPEMPHNWVTPLPNGETIKGRDILLQFDEQKVLDASCLLPELSQVEPLLSAARRGVVFRGQAKETGARLLEEIGSLRGIERIARFLDLLSVLSKAPERECLSSIDFHPVLDGNTSKILAAVSQHLAENLSAGVRLSEVAQIAGMTDSSFSRFFKARTGNTFSRHLSALRTGKACELLSRTDMAVTEICAEVGYDNLSNFNRTFRVVHGMTPSAYRKLTRA